MLSCICQLLFDVPATALADEFKDFEEDSKYRPYRPVPSGLIKLRELAWIWIACIVLQLVMALWLSPKSIGLLLESRGYIRADEQGVLCVDWLKARPIVYMITHMAIMPLVDLYTTACDWVPMGYQKPPPGSVVPAGELLQRRGAGDWKKDPDACGCEEAGVETYSFLWGRRERWVFG